MENEARDLIKYLRSIGLNVHTSTKARGHQGFYMKNRIDISKNIPQSRIIPTLLHEFTHYVHSQLEPQIERTGGTLETVFDDDKPDFYIDELQKITNIVDENSKFEKLIAHKSLVKNDIKNFEKIIKTKYPHFQRSKKFKEFDKYIKTSDAKFLLKYDRIKLISAPGKYRLLSISDLEKDFPDMPEEFSAYIKLKSCCKKQTRISSKINRMKKYYSRPTELFARFVEGLYLYHDDVKKIAPNSYKRFFELLNSGYYKELAEISKYIDIKSD